MEASNNEKIIALLIDGDNVPSEYIDAIEQEATLLGRVTHKRLYYTYDDGIPNKWEDKLNPHSLRPVQVMPYKKRSAKNKTSTVKNVADAALIVDAMDIMYQGNVNTVFIVASDSDYTIIIRRLKESGIYVIGAGEEKTAHAFVKACNEFKYLEDLKKTYSAEGIKETEAQAEESKKKAKPKTNGAKQVKKPNERTQPQPTTEKPAAVEEEDEDRKITIPKTDINNYIVKIFEQEDKNILDSGTIMQRVKGQYPSFNWKDYNGVEKSYDFYDSELFTVIQPTREHPHINVMYPAQKK